MLATTGRSVLYKLESSTAMTCANVLLAELVMTEVHVFQLSLARPRKVEGPQCCAVALLAPWILFTGRSMVFWRTKVRSVLARHGTNPLKRSRYI